MSPWLGIVAKTIVLVWIWQVCVINFASMFGVNPDSRWLEGPHWVISELRPFYLPAAVLVVAADSLNGQLGGWNLFIDAMNFVNWFLFKDKSDDRWKRRRTKLVAKVKALVSGRLVAVPVGAS